MMRNPAAEVLKLPELLEPILLKLNCDDIVGWKTLLMAQHVNRTFRDVIADSKRLQGTLYDVSEYGFMEDIFRVMERGRILGHGYQLRILFQWKSFHPDGTHAQTVYETLDITDEHLLARERCPASSWTRLVLRRLTLDSRPLSLEVYLGHIVAPNRFFCRMTDVLVGETLGGLLERAAIQKEWLYDEKWSTQRWWSLNHRRTTTGTS